MFKDVTLRFVTRFHILDIAINNTLFAFPLTFAVFREELTKQKEVSLRSQKTIKDMEAMLTRQKNKIKVSLIMLQPGWTTI